MVCFLPAGPSCSRPGMERRGPPGSLGNEKGGGELGGPKGVITVVDGGGERGRCRQEGLQGEGQVGGPRVRLEICRGRHLSECPEDQRLGCWWFALWFQMWAHGGKGGAECVLSFSLGQFSLVHQSGPPGVIPEGQGDSHCEASSVSSPPPCKQAPAKALLITF